MAKMSGVNTRGKAAAPATTAAPISLSAEQQAAIEAACEATSRMSRVDRVFHWDKRQAAQVWADVDGKILTAEQLATDEQAEALAGIGSVIGVRPALIRHHLVQAPTVLVCGHDKTHGRLVMHGGGSLLMCMATKNGAACTYNQPVSV